MAKRVESPSSINTFKQCRRKYYYQYIEKLPTFPNIHTVRGNIAHSCLEHFYDIDASSFTQENFKQKCREAVQKLLLHQWGAYKKEVEGLKLSQDQLRFYFEETMLMLINWVNQFLEKLEETTRKKQISLQEAFMYLTPVREMEYTSNNYSVRGFIDAIQHLEDEVHIIDYKTNSSLEVKDSIRLQLAIYSLLYFEKHGKLPSKAGIFFLRHKLKLVPVDEELLALAKKEIELIHAHTSTTETKEDYPKTVTPLCKWNGGQCDFYEVCKPHG
ncbi:MAG: PD-(D/E)XK nuclease family protein [Nanoarchaeota archaeon]|nr:PD-(D/E)XK nuclease family protein [Nanoarchaeota archaeon]